MKKNYASYFISRCLKLLPQNVIIISYADSNINHIGCIYQATNWIYSGESSGRLEYILDGVETHAKSINNKYKTSSIPKLKEMGIDVETKRMECKHRYFYPLAKSKKEKKLMIKWIVDTFGQEPYPKGEKINYDIEDIKAKDTTPKKGMFF